MHYLEKWFKHNGLWIALSTLVASFCALYSVKLFLLLVVIVILLVWRKTATTMIVVICVWSIVCFFYFEARLVANNEAPTLPLELVWTEQYKVNGDELRGFMKATTGERYYVVYKWNDEQSKQKMLQQSLAGQRFIVTAGEWEDVRLKPKVHAYSFSMATYLKGKNAKGTLQVTSWQSNGQEKTLQTMLAAYRFNLNQHIERTFPQSLVAEAQALIFGNQQQVDEEMNRAYQKLGITHLFAISGLHIALLYLFLYELLIRCWVRIQLAQLIVVIALPIYACLAGGAPSVWRAVLLVEILFAVKMLKGRLGIDDALAFALTISVLWQPAIVLQIGFQLSYVTCFSLIYGQRFLVQPYWWQQGFVMTLLCQLLAYPILLFHFYELSLSSFVANIVFVPLFSFIILPINVVLFVMTWIMPSVVNRLFSIYEPLRQYLTDIILRMQDIPYQLWIPGKPSLVVMGLLFVTVIVSFVLWEKGRKWLAICIVIVPACLFSMRHIVQTDLLITFVDVGQGDCIVIELPRRQGVYVVDSGGLLRFSKTDWRTKNNLYEVGTQVVVPFLKGKGIRRIDTFVLSHADADHVEGAEEVMDEIWVKEIHVSPNSMQELAMKDVLQTAAKQQVQIVEQLAGKSWQDGGIQFSYLWPNDRKYEGNNDSLVLQIQYGQFRALFTGDLEEAGERALVKSGVLKRVTVLKAGHHGSKTSSSEAFIKAITPAMTIFMAGENNRYNHPHPEIMERFQQLGFQTLSTKEQQTIEIRTNGQYVEISSMAP